MKTLYLANGTVTGTPTGTITDPIRVNDATEFDNVLRRREPYRYVLHPGTYLTRGAWAFPERGFASLDADCELIGLGGSYGTTIKLDANYEKQVLVDAQGRRVPAESVVAFIAGARVGTSEHLRIEGITFDCDADLPTVGLFAYTGRAVIRDVRVINLWGSWESHWESFGILINNCQKPVINGGHVVEDCRVEQVRAGTYITALYCGVVDTGVPLELSNVSRCSVRSPLPASGVRSHAAYAANMRTRISGCYAEGFDRWFFCDTGDVVDVLVDGCFGSFGYCAVDLPGPVRADNIIRRRANIKVVNCTFDCLQPSSNHAILINAQDNSADSNSFPLEDIVVQDCTIRSVPTDFFAVSIKAAKAQRIKVHNVVLPLGVKTSAGVFAPTGVDVVSFT